MTEVEFVKKIATNIQLLRKEKNITQEMLAKSIGWNRSAVARIEKGEIASSILHYWKISVALEIDIRDVFEIKD